MPAHAESAVAQNLHDLDLIPRELTHGVRRMIRPARGRTTVPVAAQIGQDHRMPFGEQRRNPMPHHMGFRNAVQQKQRRPVTAAAAMNRRTVDIEIEFIEGVEHRGRLSEIVVRRTMTTVRSISLNRRS
jgi:hypothetical protein